MKSEKSLVHRTLLAQAGRMPRENRGIARRAEVGEKEAAGRQASTEK